MIKLSFQVNFSFMHFSCSIGDEEEKKEVGWKLVHSDVFRCPQNISLLCAILGTGTQLLIL